MLSPRRYIFTAGSRWKNIQKAQQSTKNSTGQTTGTEAHRKRKSYTKRKELDLLFDVDGPPSKMKREEGKKRLSLGEKKTILGERYKISVHVYKVVLKIVNRKPIFRPKEGDPLMFSFLLIKTGFHIYIY